jgi:hypothetical protein
MVLSNLEQHGGHDCCRIHSRTLRGAKLFVQEEYPEAVAGWLTEFLGIAA